MSTPATDSNASTSASNLSKTHSPTPSVISITPSIDTISSPVVLSTTPPTPSSTKPHAIPQNLHRTSSSRSLRGSVSKPSFNSSTRLDVGSPAARPLSRASSRSSRAPSPSLSGSLEDPVAVRAHISSLKHNIRQQQAQLHSLENIVLSGPRPLPRGFMPSATNGHGHSPTLTSFVDLTSPSSENGFAQNGPNGTSPNGTSMSPPSAFSMANGTSTPTTKMQRRSSFEVLAGMAGPDSLLPLPSKAGGALNGDGIREGVPMEFGVPSLSGLTSPQLARRTSSPTRTLSRIPVASVGHARTLAEETGQHLPTHNYQHNRPAHMSLDNTSLASSTSSNQLSASTSSHASTNTSYTVASSPVSPNKRLSMGTGGGNTTKVLADLQAGVINARAALENTKGQLRLSQRSVAQLTRQVEDLKEVRERMRLENEGLNNVVARKERLLQEVLERARKAEAEATTLKGQLKNETTSSKKSIRDLETALAESSALSQKSEREYLALRDALKHLSEGWKADLEGVRRDMAKKEEGWRKEQEETGKKCRSLLEELRLEKEARVELKKMHDEKEALERRWEAEMKKEIEALRDHVTRSGKDSGEAEKMAKETADELARMRRMLRAVDGARRSGLPQPVPSQGQPGQEQTASADKD